MTEKYKLEISEPHIEDTETGECYDLHGKDNLMYIVELWNKIADENEQLKEALIELKEIGDYQEGRIKELSDENDQLQEELLQCKAVIEKRWSEYLKKKEGQENE